MSNLSVIESLERELDLYKSGQFSRDQIGKRLKDHIEALEGIPYSVIKEAGHFQYELEIDGFYFEEECESKSDELHAKIREWLFELRKKYCQG